MLNCNTSDRARGMMLGLAIGDALGSPVEFTDLDKIKKTYGARGIRDYIRDTGMFTDDTQMSMSVAEALIEAGRLPLEGLMEAVARRFIEWYESPDNFRSPGVSTKLACRRLLEGIPWRLAGDKGSKGCGSVMRTAPVGFYYRDDMARLREAAHNIGLATHWQPTADAACVLRSINNSGDSDSIGCVAGGLQGARLGVAAIPEKWVQGIERGADLEALADRLNAATEATHG
jgi:ADP-ribosylglycohydrolase